MAEFDLDAALARLKQHVATRSPQGKPAKALVVTHDNPDPDSLAAAWGLTELLRHELGLDARVAQAGIIGRAENRAMVRVLRLPLSNLWEVHLEDYAVVALVDTQPRTGNNSLPAWRTPEIVVDHHPPRPESARVPWCHIDEEVGATCTIVYGYLERRGIELDARLATAFFYAIRSETRDLGREASPRDKAVYLALAGKADTRWLYEIQNPKVPREYFASLDRSLRRARLRGDLLTIDMGELEYPDLVAEVADFMLRCEDARWTFVIGRFGSDVHCSLRSELSDAKAGTLLRTVMGTDGTAGGHGMVAGGRWNQPVTSDEEEARIAAELIGRLAGEIGVAQKPVRPLI